MSRHAHVAGPGVLGTVLYPAALVALFLGCQVLLGLMGVAEGQRAAIAALPAVLALVVSLPLRVRHVWGVPAPWRTLGLQVPWPAAVQAVVRGLLKAMLLLALVLTGLALAGALSWQPRWSLGPLLNAALLGVGVGFAEELLFRGWLLGELALLLGSQRALWVQSAVFSLVHTRFDLQGPLLGGLLGGLLLLGLGLGLQRRADGGLLWGAIGLHGGLVGGWFLLLQELVIVKPTAPDWLIGPANPVGGALGWLGLFLLILARHTWWPKP